MLPYLAAPWILWALALPGLFTPRGSRLRCRHGISADEVSIPVDVLGSRDRNGANGAKLLSDGWGGANNLLNLEQVWAISNWVRCCGCRKVAHKLLDFCKTRDPQKRSKKDVTSHASLDIPRMTSDFYRPHGPHGSHGHPHKESAFDPHRQVTSQVGVVHGASTASATSATVGEVHMDRTRQMRQWQDGCPSAVVRTVVKAQKAQLQQGAFTWGQSVKFASIDMGNQDESSVCFALCIFVQDEGYYIVGVHLSSPIIVWIFNGVIRYFAWVGV